jgi:hypothetical protein
MGVTFSHGAYEGSYSGFDELRRRVFALAGYGELDTVEGFTEPTETSPARLSLAYPGVVAMRPWPPGVTRGLVAQPRPAPMRTCGSAILVSVPRLEALGPRMIPAAGGRMRRITASLALAMCLLGCGAARASLGAAQASPDSSASGAMATFDPSGPMANMAHDLDPPGVYPCPTTVWITGVIVRDGRGHAVIQDDQGVVTPLVWGTRNTAVVEWGHRYRIGGGWFDDYALWACAGADAVIPQ